jgi:predicted HNH restriction endonuclease
MKFAIITENDESKWADQTGILYHFPARYKNLLTEGTKVIYYKGALKNKKFLTQRLSKEPHYFGIATVGEVYAGKDNKNEYFAIIENYIPFLESVSFKQDNEYLEIVSKSNYWRDGVRKITKDIYSKIVSRSSLDIKSNLAGGFEVEIKEEILPSIENVNAELADNLLNNSRITKDIGNVNTTGSSRYTRNAKKIGDRAEEIVLKYLESIKMTNIRWLANEGIKPGYDISCLDLGGEELYIEVKGTTTSKFDGFIITSNELEKSKELGGNYYIFFVTNCLSENPKIQPIQNPYQKLELNKWELTPISYKVTFS